jgi:hypothetical protein
MWLQVNDTGGLVCWGGDIAGGSNLSLLVSPSVEVEGELALLLEPPEAAGGCQSCECVRRCGSVGDRLQAWRVKAV